jgi:hypothetical protein
MNPPTPGHLKLIQILMITGVILNVPEVFVYISTSIKDKDNPIECENKLDAIGRNHDTYRSNTTMIQSIKELMLSPDDSWLDKFEDVIILNDLRERWLSNMEEYNSRLISLTVHTICAQIQFVTALSVVKENISHIRNIIYFYGNEPDKIKMNDSFYASCTKAGYSGAYNGIALDRPNMDEWKNKTVEELEEAIFTENISDKIPVEAISASIVRKLVRNNKLEAFFALYSPYLEPSKIEILFRQIDEGLIIRPEVATTKSKTKKGKGIFRIRSRRRKSSRRRSRRSRKSRRRMRNL